MKRRDFVRNSAIATAGLSLGAAGELNAAKAQPNVLFIMVDQLRQPKWTPHVKTPNMDRLAAEGVSFTNNFTAAVACSPSRACMLTGTYTTQNQVYQNVDWMFFAQPSLDPKIPTMGHVFGKAGYRTPYRGKWHITKKKERKQALAPYGFEGWTEKDPVTGKKANCGENAGGLDNCGLNEDPIFTRQTTDWLLDPANHKQPWSMVCSLVNPHDVCQYPRAYPEWENRPLVTAKPPDNWTDDLSTKPGAQREYQELYNSLFGRVNGNDPDAWRRYLDYYVFCIEDVDKHIGMVLDALEKSGQKDNTIVVFTSDHGEMAGSHKLRVKGPFAYEEEINIPLTFSWPGHIPKGVTTDAMVSNVDIMPTLCSLAGISNMPYQAGLDLSPILANPETAQGREHVIFHMNGNTKPLKSSFGRIQRWAIKSPAHIRAIRTDEWKYVQYFDPNVDDEEYELYNMKDDPMEMTNLASDEGYKNKRNKLHDRLMAQERKLKKEFRL